MVVRDMACIMRRCMVPVALIFLANAAVGATVSNNDAADDSSNNQAGSQLEGTNPHHTHFKPRFGVAGVASSKHRRVAWQQVQQHLGNAKRSPDAKEVIPEIGNEVLAVTSKAKPPVSEVAVEQAVDVAEDTSAKSDSVDDLGMVDKDADLDAAGTFVDAPSTSLDASTEPASTEDVSSFSEPEQNANAGGSVADMKQELKQTKDADEAAIESLSQQLTQVDHNAKSTVSDMNNRLHKAEAAARSVTQQLTGVASQASHLRRVRAAAIAKNNHLAQKLAAFESKAKAKERVVHNKMEQELLAKEKVLKATKEGLRKAQEDAVDATARVSELRKQLTNFTARLKGEETQQQERQAEEAKKQSQLKDAQQAQRTLTSELVKARMISTKETTKGRVLHKQIGKLWHSKSAQIRALKSALNNLQAKTDATMHKMSDDWKRDRAMDQKTIQDLKDKIEMLQQSDNENSSAIQSEQTIAQQDLSQTQATEAKLEAEKTQQKGDLAALDAKVKDVTSQLQDQKELTDPLREEVVDTDSKLRKAEPELSAAKLQEVQGRKSFEKQTNELSKQGQQLSSQVQAEKVAVATESKRLQTLSQENETAQQPALLQSLKLQDLEAKAQDARENAFSIFKSEETALEEDSKKTKSKVSELQKALELADSKAATQKKVGEHNLAELTKQQASLNSHLALASGKLAEQKRLIAKSNSMLQSSKTNIDTTHKQVASQERVVKQMAEETWMLKTQVSQLEARLADAQEDAKERIADLETKSKAAWRQVSALQKEISRSTSNATQMSYLTSATNMGTHDLTAQIKAKSQKAALMHEEKDHLRTQLDESISREQSKQKEVANKLQEQIGNLSSKVKTTMQKAASWKENTQTQVDSLKNEHSRTAALLQDTQKQLTSFQSLAQNRGNEIEQQTADLDKLQREIAKRQKHLNVLSAAVAAAKDDASELQARFNETEKVTSATKGRMTSQVTRWQKQRDELVARAAKAEAEANRTAHMLSEAQAAGNALKKALADKQHDIQQLSTEEQKTAEETKKQLRQSRFERKNQSETFHKQSDLIQRQLHDLHISNEQAQREAAEQIIELVQGGKKANATLQQTLQMLKHVQSKSLKDEQVTKQLVPKLQAVHQQVNDTIALHNHTLVHANLLSQNLSAVRILKKSVEANYTQLENAGVAMKEKLMNEAYELRVALNASETPWHADQARLTKQNKVAAIMQRELEKKTHLAGYIQEQEKQMLQNASVDLRTGLAEEAQEQNRSHLKETQLVESLADLKEKVAEARNYSQGNISLMAESRNAVDASLSDAKQQLASINKQNAAEAATQNQNEVKIKAQSKLLKSRQATLDKVTKELKRLQGGIPQLQQKDENIERTAGNKIGALQEKVRKWSSEESDLQEKVKNVTGNVSETKRALQNETHMLKETTRLLQGQLQDMQKDYKQQQQKIKTDAKHIQRLQQESKHASKVLRNNTRLIQTMERKLDKKMQFVENLQATVDSVQEQSQKTIDKLHATQEDLKQAQKTKDQMEDTKQQLYQDIKKEKHAIIEEQKTQEAQAIRDNQTLLKVEERHRQNRWPLRQEVEKLQQELSFQRGAIRNRSVEVAKLEREDKSRDTMLAQAEQRLQQEQNQEQRHQAYLQQMKAQRDQLTETLDHEHNATLFSIEGLKRERAIARELHARIVQQKQSASGQIHALNNQIKSETDEKMHWAKAANRSQANATHLSRELKQERHQMGAEMGAKGRALQDMREQLSQTEEDFKEHLGSLVHHTNNTEARMRNYTARISHLQLEKARATATTRNLQQGLRNLNSENQKLNEELKSLKEQERQLQQQYKVQKQRVHSLNRALEQQEDQTAELKDNETRTLERANKTLSRENRAHHREVSTGRKEVRQLQEHIQNETSIAQNKKRQMSALQKTRKMLEQAVHKASNEVQATQALVDKMKVYLQRQQSEIEQLGQQIDAEKNHTHKQHSLKQKAEHKIAALKDELDQQNTTAAHKEKMLSKQTRNLTMEERRLDQTLNLSESRTRPEAEDQLKKIQHALHNQKMAVQDAKDKDQADLRNISNETATRSRRLSVVKKKGARLDKALKQSRLAVNKASKQADEGQSNLTATKKHEGKLQQKLGALQAGLRRAQQNSTALLLAYRREEHDDSVRTDKSTDNEKQLKEAAKERRGNLTKMLKSQRAAFRRTNSELQKVQGENSVDQGDIDKLEKQAKTLQRQQQSLAKQKVALQKGGQQLIAKFDLLRHQSAIINTRLVSDQNTITRQRQQNAIVEERNQGLSETGEALRSQIVGLKSDWTAKKDETAVTAKQLGDQKASIHSLQVENKVLKSLEDADKHEDDGVQDQNRALRQKIASLMQKTADLESQRDSLSKEVHEEEQARKTASMGSDSAYEEVASLTGKGEGLKASLTKAEKMRGSLRKKLKELESTEGTDHAKRMQEESLLVEAQARHDALQKRLKKAQALLKKTQLRSKLAYNALSADQKKAVGQIPSHAVVAAAPVLPVAPVPVIPAPMAPLRSSSGFLQTAAQPFPPSGAVTPSSIVAMSAAIAPPLAQAAPPMSLEEANKQSSVPLAQLFPTPAPVLAPISAAFPSLPLPAYNPAPPPPVLSSSSTNSAFPAPPMPSGSAQSPLGLALSHIGEGYKFQDAPAGSLTQEPIAQVDPMALARGDSTVETLINSAAKQ